MEFKNYVYYIDGKIKFMYIEGITLVEEWAPGEVRAPFIEKWQSFVDQEKERAATEAPTMVGMRQTAGAWTSVAVERAFVTSAFQGIIIAMTFSFIVLMITTRNFITSLSSIICVVVIITSILTFMYWDGQQFGSN